MLLTGVRCRVMAASGSGMGRTSVWCLSALSIGNYPLLDPRSVTHCSLVAMVAHWIDRRRVEWLPSGRQVSAGERSVITHRLDLVVQLSFSFSLF